MTNVVVHEVWAVGMHHWGSKELSVDSVYKLRAERYNPKDKNAIAIEEQSPPYKKRAYVIKEMAEKLQPVLTHCPCILKSATLKVESHPVVKCHEKGPQQYCCVYLQAAKHKELHLEHILNENNICYTIEE